jgi:hypothetical protein
MFGLGGGDRNTDVIMDRDLNPDQYRNGLRWAEKELSRFRHVAKIDDNGAFPHEAIFLHYSNDTIPLAVFKAFHYHDYKPITVEANPLGPGKLKADFRHEDELNWE